MKKLIAVLASAAVVLTLAGCSAPAEQAISTSTDAAKPTAAAITQAPAAQEDATPATDEAQYLEVLSAVWQGDAPSNDELLSAGELACDGLSEGKAPGELVVVEGSDDDSVTNNGRVVTAATQFLCPEYF